MVAPVRHRQTKEAATDMFDLQPPRHISTLPNSDLILRRSEMTRCAISGLMHRNKQHLYSITSSANNRNDSGIVRPSDLAVFRLTTNWNLVGNCTGSSPGFAPRRMRST